MLASHFGDFSHVPGAYPDLRHARQWPAFYFGRFTRIWPLHAVILTIVIALHPWYMAEPTVVLANFLLVQSWSPNLNVAFSLNGVAWSISNEVFFYLLFPLVLASRHRFLWWYIATISIVLVVILVGNHFQPVFTEDMGSSWSNFAHVGPPVRFWYFSQAWVWG
ncbi:acyltransferase family protein [Billgrantia pellis]|uniref:Acyltransferase family protein n=1 Tax=Billgrantia pellis TaxID=2606936 RepID=A0A7V7G1R2_9GAMM|nr:acyltransferase family protein [Halomonas pellis]KAA0012898.1 acyltransferase family protein [Halomonas pellis]